MPWLINAAQLDKFRKSQKNLLILDASWHMPSTERNAKQEFINKHIIDSQFFDIKELADPNPELPHKNMVLLDEKLISEKMGALGIRNDYKIIFYDNSSLHTSCRALWMFKLFGHNPQLLYILDGGLDAWERYGGKVESGEVNITPRQYKVNFQPNLIRNLQQMKNNEKEPSEQVLDARHAVRFAGGPEDRAGLRPGHIPKSYSFPYSTLFDKNNCWRPLEKIRQQLIGTGIDLNKPIVTSCGTGTSAPILNFTLDILGQTANSVYNGSWTEWGAEKLYPGESSLDERPVRTSLD